MPLFPSSGLLPNAVLPPSLDHNYAQWQERQELSRAEHPHLMKKIIPAPRPKTPGEPDSPASPPPLPPSLPPPPPLLPGKAISKYMYKYLHTLFLHILSLNWFSYKFKLCLMSSLQIVKTARSSLPRQALVIIGNVFCV